MLKKIVLVATIALSVLVRHSLLCCKPLIICKHEKLLITCKDCNYPAEQKKLKQIITEKKDKLAKQKLTGHMIF